jgi:hypothetical protein
MCRKLVFLISFVLVFSLAGSAFAITYNYFWTNATGNGLWTTPGNWGPLGPPDTAPVGSIVNIFLAGTPTTRLMPLTIPPGYDADCTDTSCTIFGPEWGLHLDIYGKLGFDWTIAVVQGLAGLNDPCNPDNDPNRSVINMYDGSEMYGPYDGRCEVICLGLSWWVAQPYVTMNMYGDSVVYTNGLILGGHLNLYGGTMDVLNYVNMGEREGYTVPDNLLRIDIHKGTLILPIGYEVAFSDWIDRGIIKAYGRTPGLPGGPQLIINLINPPGSRIIITATPGPSDIDKDGDVDFEDYALLANQWMTENCAEPDWCGGADLNKSGKVDFEDLDIFADLWLLGTTY